MTSSERTKNDDQQRQLSHHPVVQIQPQKPRHLHPDLAWRIFPNSLVFQMASSRNRKNIFPHHSMGTFRLRHGLPPQLDSPPHPILRTEHRPPRQMEPTRLPIARRSPQGGATTHRVLAPSTVTCHSDRSEPTHFLSRSLLSERVGSRSGGTSLRSQPRSQLTCKTPRSNPSIPDSPPQSTPPSSPLLHH